MIILIRTIIENERILNKEETRYDYVFGIHSFVVRYYQ
jgi:hypothetical protein